MVCRMRQVALCGAIAMAMAALPIASLASSDNDEAAEAGGPPIREWRTQPVPTHNYEDAMLYLSLGETAEEWTRQATVGTIPEATGSIPARAVLAEYTDRTAP